MNLPKTLKMPLLSGFGKRPQGIIRKLKYSGWFGFQNCFWNLFSTSALTQIYKIRNVWKLPIPFSAITLILGFEKSAWSLKISFWKKNCPLISKTVMKTFSHYGFPVNP
jgi:EamA domain-containing membrane protein RarD